jgi:hypothetical protein
MREVTQLDLDLARGVAREDLGGVAAAEANRRNLPDLEPVEPDASAEVVADPALAGAR